MGQNTERADRPEVRETPVEPAQFVMLLEWGLTGVLAVLSPFLLMELNNTMIIKKPTKTHKRHSGT